MPRRRPPPPTGHRAPEPIAPSTLQPTRRIPMSATLIVRHPVSDYATWRITYDSDTVRALHDKHAVTDSQVLRAAEDANDITVIHRFDTVADAHALAEDPALKEAMAAAGV